MKRMKAFIALFLIAATLHATTVIPMSVERLTEASSRVVMAQAQDSWTELSADKKLIYTVTRFAVQKSYKGQPAETVLVRSMGGRMGNIEQKVSGVRSWRSGERAVLFLRESVVNDGTLAVTGIMQGDFRFVRDIATGEQYVSNGVPDVESFDAQTRKTSVYTGSKLPLRELERRVMQAVTK